MQSRLHSTNPMFKTVIILLILLLLATVTALPAFAGTKSGTSTNGKSSWKNRTAAVDAYSLSVDNRPPQISGAPALDVTITEDSLYSLRLNASDPNPGDSLAWRISVQPQFGKASILGTGFSPELSYLPGPDFNGEDAFTVQVSDLSGASVLLPVSVNVLPANDFSEAADFSASGNEDSFLTFSYGDFAARFTDPEGAKLQAIRISPLPSYGTLFLGSDRLHEGEEILPGLLESLIYLPDNDWFGSDSFGWAGSDGAAYSQVTGLVSLAISPANDDPQITDDLHGPVVMDEDSAPRAFSLVLHAADADLVDTFTWSITQQPENGMAFLEAHGFKASLGYHPSPGYSGEDAFIVQVEDGKGGKDTIEVEIEIQPVNNTPQVTNSVAETTEESPLHFDQKDFLENYSDDADHDRMQGIRITSVAAHGELLLNEVLVKPADEIPVDELDSLVYKPAANFTGTDTFAWSGCDGKGCSDGPATLSVQVANQNDAPQIQPGDSIRVTMDEDSSQHPFELTLHTADPDPNETLTWSLQVPPLNGTARVSGGGSDLPIHYSPRKDFSGTDEFTVQVMDASGEVDSILVTVQVNPSNDLPVVASIVTGGVEDASIGFTPDQFMAQFSDIDGDLMASVKINTLPAHGLLTLAGELVKNGQEFDPVAMSNLIYQPDANYSGMDYFEWTGSDGKGWASPGTLVSLTIAPVEDAPTLMETGPFQIELTSARLPSEHHLVLHADDKDNDTLSWVLVASPAYGTLLATGEGYALNLDYVPGNTFQGTDTFTIHLTDGHTAPMVIDFTVSGQLTNRPPTSADGVVDISVSQDYIFRLVDFPFTDLDGNTLQALQISSLPAEGNLYLDKNSDAMLTNDEKVIAGQMISIEEFGSFKYKPSSAPASSQAVTFTFIVNDGSLSSLSGNLMLLRLTTQTKLVFVPLLQK